MLKAINNKLKETKYEIKDEALNATLFGIGNGYFGIRGSFEEFGDVGVQGTYVRGVFDQIIEIPNASPDNEYMKKYYFDEQKLKEFEYEDSCLNICDFTSMKVYVGGKLFLPYESKIRKWERYIDLSDGSLIRKVTFADESGHLTRLCFYRVASFADNHVFLQKVSIEKLNHDLDIDIRSGVDTLVKTNGQKKSRLTLMNYSKGVTSLHFALGEKYHMSASLVFADQAQNASFARVGDEAGVIYNEYHMDGRKAEVTKVAYLAASCDYPLGTDIDGETKKAFAVLPDFAGLLAAHKAKYRHDFRQIDVKLSGSKELDTVNRYAIYQTLIGLDRHDSVHSLSAKNLTAEKYNQFVWWDCEIFQLPVFMLTFPEAARKCLEYRYRCLPAAKEEAAKAGLLGAKYAFCSSVRGDEQVWIYARHPFLQIHITLDVAYGIINYYRHTNDREFMLSMGLEMLEQISAYIMSRSAFRDGRYQIIGVTGTDEHHPYIDNNAYTNYEAGFVCQQTARLLRVFGRNSELSSQAENYAKRLYLPTEKGLIPQFDGYFGLKKYLPLAGNGNGTNFQMRQSGLYHKSQIIKQPDVMMLYSYLNIGLDEGYHKNWKYYEPLCEASSSLTYPVHAICAIDNGEKDKFVDYYQKSVRVDIDDLFRGSSQGVHAAALSASYYAIFRGVLGIEVGEETLSAHPHYISSLGDINLSFFYHGQKVKAHLAATGLTLRSRNPIKVLSHGRLHEGKIIQVPVL